jgi:hypothetical protein
MLAKRPPLSQELQPEMLQSAHFCDVSHAFPSGETHEVVRQRQRQNPNREIEFD